MVDIIVQVSIDDKGNVSYAAAISPADSPVTVSSDGDIDIPAGEDVIITFVPAAGQGWTLDVPGISLTFESGSQGDAVLGAQTSTGASIVDSALEPDQYNYTLLTTKGTLDPKIINRG